MPVKTRWPDRLSTSFYPRQTSYENANQAEYNYASNLKLDEMMMTVKCWTLYNHKLLISTPRRLGVKNIRNFDSNHNFIFCINSEFFFQTRFCFRPEHWDLRRESRGTRKKWNVSEVLWSRSEAVTSVTWVTGPAWHGSRDTRDTLMSVTPRH